MKFVELETVWFKAEYADDNFELITVFNNNYNDAFVISQVLYEATKSDLMIEHGALMSLSVVDSEYNIVKTIFDFNQMEENT